MWKTVCRVCGWTSGESYLQLIAEAIGKVHEEDNTGHTVVKKEVSTFASDLEGKEDLKPDAPGPSKS